MIRLGLRLTLAGGREAAVRLVIIGAAVMLGVGLLLISVAGVNAVGTQNARYAWLATGMQTGPTAGATGSSATAGGTTTGGTTTGGTATGGTTTGAVDPAWWLLRADFYHGQVIGRVDVAATGPDSPVPPGIPSLPGPGQYYASPAMAALLRSTPAAQLGDRYPGQSIGTIGDAALPAPNTLLIIIGHTADQVSRLPGAQRITAFNNVSPSSCFGEACAVGIGINSNGMALILSVIAIGLLFPVLVFIATATRLSAARREERFAAIRLAGATPRQISVISAVESTAAAVAGVAAGFALFYALRPAVASVPFTGAPFFTSDLSLNATNILLVAIGVPVAGALAAWIALRRVRISPLGVTRRATPPAPRAWRLIPLIAGIAELAYFVKVGRPRTTQDQTYAYATGFLLVLIGLVTAGPWLTMVASRGMARLARRPATLIAARRLADNPRAGFRAISGLVLALFVATVATGVITASSAPRPGEPTGALRTDVLAQIFATYPTGRGSVPVPDTVVTDLRTIPGVRSVVRLHPYDRRVELRIQWAGGAPGPGRPLSAGQAAPQVVASIGPPRQGLAPPPAVIQGAGGQVTVVQDIDAELVSCADLAATPLLPYHCPSGAQVVAIPGLYDAAIGSVGRTGQPITGLVRSWPAVDIPATRLDTMPVSTVAAVTNGSTAAIEGSRTVLENAFPSRIDPPDTYQDSFSLGNTARYQQLADVIILVSLVVAGCTLAVSVVAGLTQRKRPFALLRLAGAPLRTLRRVVALESAVPLLAVAVVSIGVAFLAADLFLHSQMKLSLLPPGTGYYATVGAGLILSLAIIGATMPLLRRITGPETARNE